MSAIRMNFIWLIPALVLASARSGAGEPVRMVTLTKIWDQGPHNAFTDFLRYRDHWICTFREGEDHASFDGSLRVLQSPDGVSWKPAALISLTPGEFADLKPAIAPDGTPIALRNPHLCITPDGRLMLNSAVAYHGRRDMQSLAWFSSDGTTWGKPVLIGEHQHWLCAPPGIKALPTESVESLACASPISTAAGMGNTSNSW
jgi:hypothetical protein